MFGAVADLRAVAAFLTMYSDIPFWLSLVLMLGGLAVLAWSSDVFVDGAAEIANDAESVLYRISIERE